MQPWKVYIHKKAFKQLKKCPLAIQDLVDKAISALEQEGPHPKYWDVKKLQANEYRLRITYRYRLRYLVVQDRVVIEVLYIGHRKNAYK